MTEIYIYIHIKNYLTKAKPVNQYFINISLSKRQAIVTYIYTVTNISLSKRQPINSKTYLHSDNDFIVKTSKHIFSL